MNSQLSEKGVRMKSIEDMDFGEYIKSLRIAEDRSLRETVIAIGVMPQFFYNVETRKYTLFPAASLSGILP